MRASIVGHLGIGWSAVGLVCWGYLVTCTGCGGCTIFSNGRDDGPPTAEAMIKEREALARRKKEKEKEQEKPPLEFRRLAVLPRAASEPLQGLKPGHWTAVAQEMIANRSDLKGTLHLAAVDRKGAPIDLAGTPFQIDAGRRVVLAKAQRKSFETTLFLPETKGSAIRLQATLTGDGGRRFVDTEFFPAMPPYQYLFVLLADQPARYTYIKVLDSVKAPSETAAAWKPIAYYQVVPVKSDRHAALPSNSFAWSSIAYLLWDDIEPSSLTERQQAALLDWLRWGGQLIISGPGSLERLRGSFLAPLLPALPAGARNITGKELDVLNRHWMPGGANRTIYRLKTGDPWVGVEMLVHAAARQVPGTGGLLVERAVGRGRIVVSAFRLSEPALVDWRSFDNFFNACLLGRPARRYVLREGGLDPSLVWAEPSYRVRDAALVTRLRYLARDLGRKWGGDEGSRGGMGAWAPLNPMGNAARQTLREAAGISVPPATFVLKVLAVYLLILVPVNWAAFRAIGRIEWAWLAAPAVAIVCGGMVIHLAQLNIGFARSRTEVALLEAHAGYARAHLTRYTALYTSLSTRYDLQFSTPDAVALPLPVHENFALVAGQSASQVTYQHGRHPRLTGFAVPSNATGMVYSEQMLEMGGSFSIERPDAGAARLHNTTRWDLEGCVVLKKEAASRSGEDAGGAVQWSAAAVGRLAAGSQVPLRFEPMEDDRPLEGLAGEVDGIDVGRLVHLVSYGRRDDRVTQWLVGRLDGTPAGVRFSPQASQVRSATLVVVDFAFSYPAPRADLNTKEMAQDTVPGRGQIAEDGGLR